MSPHSCITSSKRLFILDTNVLMHDPTALFRFMEHDVFLPIMVLEELDDAKKGVSEVARNARQASRFLDSLISGTGEDKINQGLPLLPPHYAEEELESPAGRLFFQTGKLSGQLPASLPRGKADNDILSVAIALLEKFSDTRITIVSKDINLRIKAAILGIHAEDYTNDKVLDDVDLLYSGITRLPDDFWEQQGDKLESWKSNGKTYYKVNGELARSWHPNEFLYLDTEKTFEAQVCEINKDQATISLLHDYSQAHHPVWGIMARNREQNYALNMLMDPEIDFVSLVGMAGTGKTLLTLAAGLEQTLERGLYREIIMTRVTVPVGEDIGFLPGTEEEKMAPWMGALLDNLEVLTGSENNGDWERAATQDLIQKRIKIRSLNFMRGRTFLNRFIILDEAQNLTAKQMKTLITRAGPGTKIICLGNIAQIDTPYLTETSSGLTYVVDRFKNWPHSGHITLTRGERSRLADYASDVL